MAKVLQPLACDPALLSAYRDDALEEPLRRLVELHLGDCAACRRELLTYERLAVGLRLLPVERVPHRLASDVAARALAAARPPRRRFAPREVVLAATVAVLLVLVLLFQRAPARPAALFEAYPPAGASDVSTDTAVMVTFPQSVDQDHFQQTVHFDPPVPFAVLWESPRQAEVVPLTPLSPAATYTLLAAPAHAAAPAAAQTVTVFRTSPRPAEQGGPTPVVPRAQLLARALAVSAAPTAPAPLPTSAPLPTPAPSTAIASREARPAAVAIRPVATATAATVATPAAHAVAVAAQTAATVHPAVGTTHPVSSTAAPATPSAAPSPNPAATPAAGATPATALAARPAGVAAAAATPTAAVGCVTPRGGFGQVWNARRDIRAALGCARQGARAVTVHSQVFQRGILLTLQPDALLYQLAADGSWQSMTPDALGSAPTPVATAAAVGPAFRPYLANHADVLAAFGQPIGSEELSLSALQPFAHGAMLATPGWVYILQDDGHWQRIVSAWSNAPAANGVDGAATDSGSSFGALRPRRLTPTPTLNHATAATATASGATATATAPVAGAANSLPVSAANNAGRGGSEPTRPTPAALPTPAAATACVATPQSAAASSRTPPAGPTPRACAAG